LEVLFAGQLTQRKGLAYLVAALARLDVPWRLTLAGPAPTSPPQPLARLLADGRCTRLGHVPHATLLARMERAHVLVFPSLVEGFGLVLTEAMSAGLPVITTPHTAGPDLIADGREGFLVPIRDADAIADRLARLHADEAMRRRMGAAGLARARAASWSGYEAAIAALLAEMAG
jgi:glycosyltransferase involved in cell wall biosynthesis